MTVCQSQRLISPPPLDSRVNWWNTIASGGISRKGSNMSHIGDTKHVRVEATTRAKLKAYSKKTGLSMAVIVTWCIENCLMAVENKKSVLPRILLMQQAIEGPRFEVAPASGVPRTRPRRSHPAETQPPEVEGKATLRPGNQTKEWRRLTRRRRIGDQWVVANSNGSPAESFRIELIGPKAGHWISLPAFRRKNKEQENLSSS